MHKLPSHGSRELRKRVVGQETAVEAVANAVRHRSRAGLGDPEPTDREPPLPRPDGCRKAPSWRERSPEFLFDDERAIVAAST